MKNTGKSLLNLFAAATLKNSAKVFIGMFVLELTTFLVLFIPSEERLLEQIMAECYIPLYIILLTGYVLMCLIFARLLASKNSKTKYTMQRLLTSEKEEFILQSLYSSAMFFVFMAVQAIIIAIMIGSFVLVKDDGIGTQDIFLAIYRTPLFHTFFPLGDATLWIRNIIYCFALGFSSTARSQKSREGKPDAAFIILAIVIGASFICKSETSTEMSLGFGSMVSFPLAVIFMFLEIVSGLSSQDQRKNDEYVAEMMGRVENE